MAINNLQNTWFNSLFFSSSFLLSFFFQIKHCHVFILYIVHLLFCLVERFSIFFPFWCQIRFSLHCSLITPSAVSFLASVWPVWADDEEEEQLEDDNNRPYTCSWAKRIWQKLRLLRLSGVFYLFPMKSEWRPLQHFRSGKINNNIAASQFCQLSSTVKKQKQINSQIIL